LRAKHREAEKAKQAKEVKEIKEVKEPAPEPPGWRRYASKTAEARPDKFVTGRACAKEPFRLDLVVLIHFA